MLRYQGESLLSECCQLARVEVPYQDLACRAVQLSELVDLLERIWPDIVQNDIRPNPENSNPILFVVSHKHLRAHKLVIDDNLNRGNDAQTEADRVEQGRLPVISLTLNR